MSVFAEALAQLRRHASWILDVGDRAAYVAALDLIEQRAAEMETALLALFLDPLGSHGGRALARETLGIPFIPFASAQEMLEATLTAGEVGPPVSSGNREPRSDLLARRLSAPAVNAAPAMLDGDQ